MKTRLTSRPLSSFLWVTRQCNQCCIVAVAIGWLTNKTGAGKKAALTVELNKSIVHKTSSKPIITLLFPQCSPTLSKQVPSCNWLRLQHVRYTEGVKSYSQRSRPPNFVQSMVKLWKIDSQDLEQVVAVVTTGHMGMTPPCLIILFIMFSSRGVHSNKYGVCQQWNIISSPERCSVYSRVAFIMYIPVNCQNSGRGQSKRAHTADDRFDKAISSYQLHVSGQPLCWNAARHSQKPSA